MGLFCRGSTRTSADGTLAVSTGDSETLASGLGAIDPGAFPTTLHGTFCQSVSGLRHETSNWSFLTDTRFMLEFDDFSYSTDFELVRGDAWSTSTQLYLPVGNPMLRACYLPHDSGRAVLTDGAVSPPAWSMSTGGACHGYRIGASGSFWLPAGVVDIPADGGVLSGLISADVWQDVTISNAYAVASWVGIEKMYLTFRRSNSGKIVPWWTVLVALRFETHFTYHVVKTRVSDSVVIADYTDTYAAGYCNMGERTLVNLDVSRPLQVISMEVAPESEDHPLSPVGMYSRESFPVERTGTIYSAALAATECLQITSVGFA